MEVPPPTPLYSKLRIIMKAKKRLTMKKRGLCGRNTSFSYAILMKIGDYAIVHGLHERLFKLDAIMLSQDKDHV